MADNNSPATPPRDPTTWRLQLRLLEEGPLAIAAEAADLVRQIRAWYPVLGGPAALDATPSMRDAGLCNVRNAHLRLARLLDPKGRLSEPVKPAATEVERLLQEAQRCRAGIPVAPISVGIAEQLAQEARRCCAARLVVEDVTCARADRPADRLLRSQPLLDALQAVQDLQLAVADHYEWRAALYGAPWPPPWAAGPPPISDDLVVRLATAARQVQEVAGNWAADLRQKLAVKTPNQTPDLIPYTSPVAASDLVRLLHEQGYAATVKAVDAFLRRHRGACPDSFEERDRDDRRRNEPRYLYRPEVWPCLVRHFRPPT
jgi:hypothetical protein